MSPHKHSILVCQKKQKKGGIKHQLHSWFFIENIHIL
uniref:Uncharacterized protein n=1 Tax=Rhizophora mucronata TaxID=61149 RepID=A0A2P2QJK0_RHIMU